ncbi:MAG: hypothetical protein KR126chlam2_00328 [Chlamydiae bacterium]|nr:hypothetical protein [Chlamydiota bacterium]
MTAPVGLKSLQYCPFVHRSNKADLEEGKKILKYDLAYRTAVLAIPQIIVVALLISAAVALFSCTEGLDDCVHLAWGMQSAGFGGAASMFLTGTLVAPFFRYKMSSKSLREDLENICADVPEFKGPSQYRPLNRGRDKSGIFIRGYKALTVLSPYELHRYGILSKEGAENYESAEEKYQDSKARQREWSSLCMETYGTSKQDKWEPPIQKELEDAQESVRAVFSQFRFQDNFADDLAPLPTPQNQPRS